MKHILEFFILFFYSVVGMILLFPVSIAIEEGKYHYITAFIILALLIRGGIAGISLGVKKDTIALEKYVGTSNATASIVLGIIAVILGIMGAFWTISHLLYTSDSLNS